MSREDMIFIAGWTIVILSGFMLVAYFGVKHLENQEQVVCTCNCCNH